MDPVTVDASVVTQPLKPSNKTVKILGLIVFVLSVLVIILGYLSFKGIVTDIPCGGFAGVLCPRGYSCWTKTRTVDGMGQCVRNIFKRKPAVLNDLPVVPQPTPTSKPNPEITYRNERYQFEFSYPANFVVTEGRGQYFINATPIVELESETLNITANQIEALFTITVKPDGKSDCDYIPRGNLDTLQERLINGVKFNQFSNTGAAAGSKYSRTIYHHLKDVTCYEVVTTIVESSDGNDQEGISKLEEQRNNFNGQFGQILSTFRFIDSETDIGKWSVYSDKNGNYSIRYPPNSKVYEDKTVSVDGVFVDTPGIIQIISSVINTKINLALSIKYQNLDGQKLEDIIKKDSCVSQSKGVGYKAGQINGILYKSTLCGARGLSVLYFEKNGMMYTIAIETMGVYDEVASFMGKVLSTMEFTPAKKATPTSMSTNPEGKFCGGIAGVACPTGYRCQLDGSYPDAGGTCVGQ